MADISKLSRKFLDAIDGTVKEADFNVLDNGLTAVRGEVSGSYISRETYEDAVKAFQKLPENMQKIYADLARLDQASPAGLHKKIEDLSEETRTSFGRHGALLTTEYFRCVHDKIENAGRLFDTALINVRGHVLPSNASWVSVSQAMGLNLETASRLNEAFKTGSEGRIAGKLREELGVDAASAAITARNVIGGLMNDGPPIFTGGKR